MASFLSARPTPLALSPLRAARSPAQVRSPPYLVDLRHFMFNIYE